MSEETLQSHVAVENPAEAVVAESNLSDAFHEKAEAEGEAQVEQPEAATEETAEDKEFASKFAALSRRDKEIRQKEKELESKLAEFEERMKSFEQKQEPEVEETPEIPLEYRLRKDPINTLAELGLSYDKLTELALNDGKLTTDMQMDLMRREIDEKYGSELQALKEELAEKERKAEEQKYEEVINGFMNELTSYVNSNDKYEMIKANDAVDLVYNVIEQHHQETGRILSNEEAADQVEEYLFEEAKKLLESNKLKGLYQQAKPTEEKQERQPSPTLSNELGTQVSTKGDRFLSDEESKAAISKLLKWED